MSLSRRTLVLLALVWCAGCQAPKRSGSILESTAGPFANPDLVCYIAEGGAYTYSVDDRVVLTLETRTGRLFCNEVDTGPYDSDTPLRVLSKSELLVGRERRPIPRAPQADVRSRG